MNSRSNLCRATPPGGAWGKIDSVKMGVNAKTALEQMNSRHYRFLQVNAFMGMRH